MTITRHFVSVGNRRVHYTRAGEGPAVCLLHASPCSAKVLRLQQEVFASRFTALAFDTPGFGLSDRLPHAQPRIEDFADALAETLSTLGIERSAVYGRHTGASIAVEFAARHPARCAMALTDSFPFYSGAQQEDRLTKYLQSWTPSWDGSHLIWIWFRYREQHVFWPWHAHALANRADIDVPDLDFLHRGALELMEAGPDFRIGYSAAFRHRGLAALADLKVPVCFGSRRGDSLWRLYSSYPKEAWSEEFDRDPLVAAAKEVAILARHPGSTPPPAPGCGDLPGRTTTEYVEVGDARALVRRHGFARSGRPLLILHRLPGSSALYEELIVACGETRPTIALDLAGQGESESWPDPPSVDSWARWTARTLDALGIRDAIDVFAHGSAAGVALAFAARRERCRRLVLDAPLCLEERMRLALRDAYGVDARPSWDGSHLLRVWHHLRDQRLWWPWFDRRRENARRDGELDIAPEALMRELRECVKQPANYAPTWRGVLDDPVAARVAASTQPLLVMAAPGDLFAHCAPLAASLRADAQRTTIADSPQARAAAIAAFLDG